MAVKIIRDNLDVIVMATRALANKEVLIGVPSTMAGRDDTNEANNASIAYWHEFGVPENNLPARPFLVPGVASVRERAIVRLRKAGQAALDGHPEKIDMQLAAIGLEAVSAVQDKIRNGPFVPLTIDTIKARGGNPWGVFGLKVKYMYSDQHASLTGVQPLIDTGKLLQSISYVVRKRGR